MTKDTRRGFNRLAPFYDLILKVSSGNSILKSQTVLLHTLPPLNNVLILGGGTGSFLIELLKQKEIASIVYLDISEGMINETKKKIRNKIPQHLAKIQFIQGTIEDLAPEKTFDAVFTNYFFDLFNEVELALTLKRTYSHLSQQGYWYLTDFATLDKNISNLRRPIYKIIHWLLYAFFRIVCGISATSIPNLRKELEELKLKKLEERYSLDRMLWCGIYQRS